MNSQTHGRGRFNGFTALLVVAISLPLISCQRSSSYQRDEKFYQPEFSSYYDRTNQSSTSRIETLGQPKKRVVVLDFFNDTPVSDPSLGQFAADEMRRGLFLSGKVLLSPEVKSEFTTGDFVRGSDIKVGQLIREGRRLGVAVVVIGRISKIAFRQKGGEVGLFSKRDSMAGVDIELKIFDIQAGREIAASGKSGKALSTSMVALEGESLESKEFRSDLSRLAIREAVGQLVPESVHAMEKLSWQGRIAKVVGNKIYVNAGRSSGLIAGDILRVLTNGDEVYDPATGAFLGKSEGRMKGTLEVVDFIGTDGAVAEVHTGANFKEGDSVQLY